MNFLLASLPTNSHAQNIALALHEGGNLGAYYTGAADNYRHGWSRALRQKVASVVPGLDRKLERRRISIVPEEFIYSDWGWDGLLTMANLLGLGENAKDFIWEHSELRFDARCSAQMAAAQFDAYLGIEHGALRSIQTAKELGKPAVVAFLSPHHETLREWVFREYELFPELLTPYVQRLLRLAPRRDARKDQEACSADIIVSASKFTTESLTVHAGVDPNRIITVPLGGLPTVADDIPPPPRDGVRFLYSGPFSVRKGAHHLLQAWKLLSPENVASLEVYGTVLLPDRLLERIPSNITLHGHVSSRELSNAYRNASVLVFPTLCDGFGLVVQEALAHGVPVITTANAGAADLIVNGENGFILPARDPGALATQMNWCLSHPNELFAMRTAALESAKRWTWKDFRASFREKLFHLLDEPVESVGLSADQLERTQLP